MALEQTVQGPSMLSLCSHHTLKARISPSSAKFWVLVSPFHELYLVMSHFWLTD